MSDEQDERIMGLAHDFARVWNASAIDNIDRKRLLGLLVEDTTLTREGYRVNIGLRLRGGKTHTLQAELPRPYCMEMERMPSNEVMLELEALVNAAWDNRAAAQELNRRGHRDAQGAPFLERRIQGFRKRRNWPGCTELHRTRLREQGYVDARDLASSMGIHREAVRQRAHRKQGIEACRFSVGLRNFAMYRIVPAPPMPCADKTS